MNDLEDSIVKLLRITDRRGMEDLIEFMCYNDFFISPASIKHHGNFPGGLARHSLKVYYLLRDIQEKMYHMGADAIDPDTIIIASLLHDISNMVRYDGVEGAYSYNFNHAYEEHCMLSVDIIRKYTDVTALEVLMIRYHMGVYGTVEFNRGSGEYTLKEMLEQWKRSPIIKMLYICDETAAAEGL